MDTADQEDEDGGIKDDDLEKDEDTDGNETEGTDLGKDLL